MPEGWSISEGRVNRENTGYSFKVHYVHPEYNMEFYLLHLLVRHDGTLSVIADKRSKVRKILSKPEGLRREARFFTALEMRTAKTPEWFIKAKKSHSFLDRRGVDGFAHVEVEGKTLKIPIQIKSWRHNKKDFLAKNAHLPQSILVIVADDEATDDQLRQRLYTAAGEVRSRILKRATTIEQVRLSITERINGTAR